MDRVEEPGDDEEFSFAPTPSPEEARARLAALRGKPLDAPSRLVTEEAAEVEAEPAAAQPEVSFTLPADKMVRLLALLENERPTEAVKAAAQKAFSPAKADKPLFKVKKVRITTRIDADVLAAFKATGPGYQTLMNDVLRANMPGSLDAASVLKDSERD